MVENEHNRGIFINPEEDKPNSLALQNALMDCGYVHFPHTSALETNEQGTCGVTIYQDPTGTEMLMIVRTAVHDEGHISKNDQNVSVISSRPMEEMPGDLLEKYEGYVKWLAE